MEPAEVVEEPGLMPANEGTGREGEGRIWPSDAKGSETDCELPATFDIILSRLLLEGCMTQSADVVRR